MIFAHMEGKHLLIAPLIECAQLRVKDIDFQRRETLRRGKGGKERLAMLPLSLVQPLREQLAYAEALYENDPLHPQCLRHALQPPFAARA